MQYVGQHYISCSLLDKGKCMGLFDKFKKEKTKTFEDEFVDVQEGMISLCEELAGDTAVDEICIYGSIEDGALSFNAFYLTQGKCVTASKISSEHTTIKQFLREGCDDLIRLSEVCKEYNRPVPTELRLRYKTASRRLDTHYEYDPICTLENNKLPSDIFKSWKESVEKAYEQRATETTERA